MLRAVRTIPPALTPVSIDLVKRHLRIDGTDDDLLLTMYIQAATSRLEGVGGVIDGHAFITQTWQEIFPQFPTSSDVFGLALRPVQSIVSISLYDELNNVVALDTGNYALLTDEQGAYVSLQVNGAWPTVFSREDAITITYVAGYGNHPDDVPAYMRQAILFLVGHLYENREPTAGAAMTGLSFELPLAVNWLLEAHRRYCM